MKRSVATRSALALLTVPLAWFAAGWAAPSQTPAQQAGGIVTLWAMDDLACSFDFRAGAHGARIVEGEVQLEGAQLVYDALDPGGLSYGFSTEELVRVVDLGLLTVDPLSRAQDVAAKYPISAIHTLFLDGTRFAYQEVGGKATRHRPANALLSPMVEDDRRFFEPIVGHTYLIRFQGTRRGASDQVAKFQILDVEPRRFVTFRWAPVATL